MGGNIYCQNIEGINVHKYGAHIFHTNNKTVWEFVNSLVEFNRFTNSPIANYKGEIYNMPFNMNTFNKMWGVSLSLIHIFLLWYIDRCRENGQIFVRQGMSVKAVSYTHLDVYKRQVQDAVEQIKNALN